VKIVNFIIPAFSGQNSRNFTPLDFPNRMPQRGPAASAASRMTSLIMITMVIRIRITQV
jgi:hypothetical protein